MPKKFFIALLLGAFALPIDDAPAQANDAPTRGSAFFDPDDGALDMSEWLLDRKGFLPMPIIITEPSVGYGGGLSILFFRQSMRESAAAAKRTGHVTPPDIFGVAFAATENGTKGAGAGGMFSFDQDRWRYRGGVGKIDMNLDFYGIGNDLGTGQRKIGYSLDGWISSQQILRRLGDSNNYVALRWLYMDLENSFESDRARPILRDHTFETRSSGLGVSLEHDSRDNIFVASRGWTGSIDALFYMPGIGSDKTFQTYRAHVYAYMPIARNLVLGGRLDARAARGDVPFYQLPYVDMRGIPAQRYQDENVALVETELRWNVTHRWALLGFFGAGRTWGRDDFDDAPSRVAKGAGFRYLIAKRLGLSIGLDYGWGPDDEAFYIQLGSAWR